MFKSCINYMYSVHAVCTVYAHRVLHVVCVHCAYTHRALRIHSHQIFRKQPRFLEFRKNYFRHLHCSVCVCVSVCLCVWLCGCVVCVVRKLCAQKHTRTHIHTTIQPYSHTVIQPYSHTVIQPYSHTVIQPHNHTTTQSF